MNDVFGREGEKPKAFYETFRGALIAVVCTEALLAAATWKTWFDPLITSLYLATGTLLAVLLMRARQKDTPEDYTLVEKLAFAAFLLDTVIQLVRMK